MLASVCSEDAHLDGREPLQTECALNGQLFLRVPVVERFT